MMNFPPEILLLAQKTRCRWNLSWNFNWYASCWKSGIQTDIEYSQTPELMDSEGVVQKFVLPEGSRHDPCVAIHADYC